ncbi:tyrosine-protein phosphatase [Gordonia rhizosphera]|uniref:Tyrosine specific protein phosphatases domain-containing protein n=1 Tax=Gordonia rhizosphera NBRC 16068 TaxID=1108045 RepID=K6WDY6_9ACTN|nr:tyrosine-protein phosphatase [Gordonia rhizosphera]GAB91951.1 putative protein-tyrosine phosphatase [Gordonia rhizosphera NBRC 16068]
MSSWSTTPRRRRLACAAVAVALIGAPVLAPALTPGSTGTAVAAPARMTAMAPAPEAIDLVGTENTRAFTNYRTTSGLAINGRVIRSDHLADLTPADTRKLAALRVTSIVDLRTRIEIAVAPDVAVPGAGLQTFDVLGATPVTTLVDLPTAYRAFVTDAHARSAFRRTLLEIKKTAAAGNTTLYHCTAGKDRAGWTSAVLLTILGVDRGTVERDYLASNTFRRTDATDKVNGVTIEWLRASFAAADQVYGNFDNYVHKGLGLTDADIAELKHALLVTPNPTGTSVPVR